MARVKRGVTTHARHKKVLKMARGYRGRGHSSYRVALGVSRRRCNTPIATAAPASAASARSGSSGSTPPPASMGSPIPSSCTVSRAPMWR